MKPDFFRENQKLEEQKRKEQQQKDFQEFQKIFNTTFPKEVITLFGDEMYPIEIRYLFTLIALAENSPEIAAFLKKDECRDFLCNVLEKLRGKTPQKTENVFNLILEYYKKAKAFQEFQKFKTDFYNLFSTSQSISQIEELLFPIARDNLKKLLDLADHDPSVKEFLENTALDNFWNDMLSKVDACDGLIYKHPMQPQLRVSSFHLILGRYYIEPVLQFADTNQKKHPQAEQLTSKGEDCGSFHGISLRLQYLVEQYKENSLSQEIIREKIQKLITLYGPPGYIETAEVYRKIAGYLSSNQKQFIVMLYQEGLKSLYIARYLVTPEYPDRKMQQFTPEIVNAYPNGNLSYSTYWGKELTTLDAIIDKYIGITSAYIQTEEISNLEKNAKITAGTFRTEFQSEKQMADITKITNTTQTLFLDTKKEIHDTSMSMDVS